MPGDETAPIGAATTQPLTAAGQEAASSPEWFPLRGASIRVGCTWGPSSCGNYHTHPSLDIYTAPNTPVYASGGGTATRVGGCSPHPTAPDPSCNGGNGNYIRINHGSRASLYLHLASFAVPNGSAVNAGQLIGYSGASGNTQGNNGGSFEHLHYQVVNSAGTSLDPGTLIACHGSRQVAYPHQVGASTWPGINEHNTYLRNDGTSCRSTTDTDRDDDGVPDTDDLCVTIDGVASLNGCPRGVTGASATETGDINGDGFDDVLIGIPGNPSNNVNRSGGMLAMFGGSGGFHASRQASINPGASIPGGTVATSSQANEAFAAALAVGDVNGDGFDDTMVGIPGNPSNGADGSGGMLAMFGGTSGFHASRQASINPGASIPGGSVATSSQDYERFASALATGDINGDGFDDVIIGIPGNPSNGIDGAGSVLAMFGGADGFHASRQASITPGASIPGGTVATSSQSGEGFGSSLATGDVNNDGFDDVIIGIPGNPSNGADDSGAMLAMFGGADGFHASRQASIYPGASIPGGTVATSSQANERFASSLETGDVNGDDFDDVMIGIPGNPSNNVSRSGGMLTMFGGTSGFHASRQISITPGASIPGGTVATSSQTDERFAGSLAAGDVNNDGFDDVMIGIPGNPSNNVNRSGGMLAMFGGAGGYNATRQLSINPGASIPGGTVATSSQANELFAATSVIGDVNNDGFDDLMISIPGNPSNNVDNSGALLTMFGGSDRFHASRQISITPGASIPGGTVATSSQTKEAFSGGSCLIALPDLCALTIG